MQSICYKLPLMTLMTIVLESEC